MIYQAFYWNKSSKIRLGLQLRQVPQEMDTQFEKLDPIAPSGPPSSMLVARMELLKVIFMKRRAEMVIHSRINVRFLETNVDQ